MNNNNVICKWPVLVVGLLSVAAPACAQTTYSGRVLRADGKAAGGVEVALVARLNMTDEDEEMVPQAPPVTGRTDAQGQWQLRAPEPPKQSESIEATIKKFNIKPALMAVAFSAEQGLAWRYLKADSKAPVQLKFKPTITRRFKLRDQSGANITGAQIKLQYLYPRSLGDAPEDNIYLSLPDELATRWAAKTGADGLGILNFLPPSTQPSFKIEAVGYAPISYIPYQESDVFNLTLARPISLKLRLVAPPDTPLAVSGQKLRGYISSGQQNLNYITKPLTTDANGEATLENVGPGQASFALIGQSKTKNKSFMAEIEGKFSISADEKRAVIEIPFRAVRTRLVRGKVTSSEGKPIKGVQLYGGGPGRGDYSYLGATDEKGEYSYQAGEGLNNISLSGAPNGYVSNAMREPKNFTVEAGEGEMKGPNFVLQKALSLKVLVLDPKGKPKAAARVSFNSGEEYFSRSTQNTDAKGLVTIPNLSSNMISLLARDKDAFSENKSLSPPFPALVTLQLKANGGAKLKGRVVNQYQQPVAGAKVQVIEARGRISSGPTTWTTDAKGFWQSDAFWPDGKFSLFVQAPRHLAAKTLAWQGIAGQTHDFGSVKLTRLDGFVSGVVQNAQGEPQSGARVWVRGGSSDNLSSKEGSLVTDKNGRFRVDGLTKNAVLLFAEKGNLIGAAPRMGQTAQNGVVKIVLGRYTSASKVASEADNIAAGRRIALSHVDSSLKFLKEQKDAASQRRLASLLSALSRVDQNRAAFSDVEAKASSIEQYLQKTPPDITGALARFNGIKDPMQRAYLMLSGVRKLSAAHPAQARQLIAPALAAARGVPEVSYRVIMVAKLGGAMNALDKGSGDALLQEALSKTQKLGSNDYAGFARASVAEEIVAAQPDAALDLLRDIKDDNERARYYRGVAYRLASHDAERAIKLVRDNADNWNQGDGLAALCHALALTDLPKAEALAATLDGQHKTRAYRWMIEALMGDSTPARRLDAQRLWRIAAANLSSGYDDQFGMSQISLDEMLLIAAGRNLGLPEAQNKALVSLGNAQTREATYWGNDEYYNRYELNYAITVYLADPPLGRAYLRSLVETSLSRIAQVNAQETDYYAGPLIIAAVLCDPQLADRILRQAPPQQKSVYLASLLNFVSKSQKAREENIQQMLMVGKPYDE